LLVLDAMGVVFEAANVVTEHLVPFVRSRGSDLAPPAVRELYLRGSAGALDVAALWRELGVRDPEAATEAYVRLHRLMPGARAFLGWARARGIKVACLSNDVGAWSRALRERHGLSSLIDRWVISGDVGSRKPDVAMFEALRREADVPFDAWVLVDDHRANVEAAARLGATAVGFGAVAGGARTVADFGELAALVSGLFEVPAPERPAPSEGGTDGRDG
jgi:putative hydrolase of the HAD superfamily